MHLKFGGFGCRTRVQKWRKIGEKDGTHIRRPGKSGRRTLPLNTGTTDTSFLHYFSASRSLSTSSSRPISPLSHRCGVCCTISAFVVTVLPPYACHCRLLFYKFHRYMFLLTCMPGPFQVVPARYSPSYRGLSAPLLGDHFPHLGHCHLSLSKPEPLSGYFLDIFLYCLIPLRSYDPALSISFTLSSFGCDQPGGVLAIDVAKLVGSTLVISVGSIASASGGSNNLNPPSP